MNDPAAGASGPFEARYLAFLETITTLRPSLHRYCSRMTGSVLDGEDVVQEALFQAYRKLDTLTDASAARSWIYRIATNTAIAAVDRLKEAGARSIRMTCLLASPEGLSKFQGHHADVPIWTAAVDERLNDHGYILPGLGDAGDRMYGTK